MDLSLISPEIALSGLAFLLVVLDLFIPKERSSILGYVAAIGLIIPAFFVYTLIGRQDTSFNGALVVDAYSIFFMSLFLLAAGLVILSSIEYAKRLHLPQ